MTISHLSYGQMLQNDSNKDGDESISWVNSLPIGKLDVDYSISGKKNEEGNKLKKGNIALLAEGAVLTFRNIRIQNLEETKKL
ncbi:MAG: hypothetical protein JXR07_11730 [Reichenbachiella sp.]